jgi:anaerobic selenocysteine-containing dehydrogenase
VSTSKVHTFCRICEPACALVAEVEGTEIRSLQPDVEHPIHKGFSCHKGVHYLKLHEDPERLDTPLKRLNPRTEPQGKFAPVTWDEAIGDIARRFKAIQDRYGKDALAIYNGNPSAFSGAFYSNGGQLLGGFGTSTRFSSGTQDCSAKYAGSEAVFGATMVHPIPDLLHTDYFLCIGSNPLVSHMSMIHISNPMEKLKAIRRRGGTVLFVNPRRIESSNPETGEVLLIQPDTDFYFLAGLLHEIIFNIGFDREKIEKHARNVDGAIEFVRRYPIERIAGVTGIPADEIRRVAHDFCAARSASIYMSTGVNMGRQGALAYWMLHLISLFSGNLARRGGNIYSMAVGSTTANTRAKPGNPWRQTPFGELRQMAGYWPGALMPDFFEATENPPRALLVLSGNPLLTVGGEQRLRAVLSKLELIVALDLYRSETVELADYVLPATDFLEHEDVNWLVTLGVALEPYVQYTPAVVPPKAERRDDWWILARIQQEMGIPGLLDNGNANPWGKVDALLAKANLSVEKLKALPCQTAVLPPADPGHLFEIAIQHDDKKMDCFPAALERGFRVAEDIFQELSAAPAGGLKLITLRTNYMINTWMHNIPELKLSVHQTNPLWMHPQDAFKRQLFEGDEVDVRSNAGSITAVLMFDETLKPGVVAMTHGWGHKINAMSVATRYGGANVNVLAPIGVGTFDVLSNQSHLTGIDVDVVGRLQRAQ